ncbi:hypothetical protein O6H91_Y561800 [Diphasiastrum complanatum]|nr:hypothetical protein O6H91_Y561800 [Diphasiastrum complanatum]
MQIHRGSTKSPLSPVCWDSARVAANTPTCLLKAMYCVSTTSMSVKCLAPCLMPATQIATWDAIVGLWSQFHLRSQMSRNTTILFHIVNDMSTNKSEDAKMIANLFQLQ